MEENIKDKLILILAILTVIFFVATIGSCNNALRQKNARDKEMSTRLDLEEKMTKVAQQRLTTEEQLKAKDKEIEEEKAAQLATKKALVQEQLVNQSLKEELQKVNKLKDALEEELVANKSKNKK